MDNCRFCGAKTSLYDSGRPVCVKCLDDIEHGKILRPRQPVSAGSPPDAAAKEA